MSDRATPANTANNNIPEQQRILDQKRRAMDLMFKERRKSAINERRAKLMNNEEYLNGLMTLATPPKIK